MAKQNRSLAILNFNGLLSASATFHDFLDNIIDNERNVLPAGHPKMFNSLNK